jgi:3-phosphoshikimate 1-carboxyvinyltransferase
MNIFPSVLQGELNIQPSKSVLHRALICAALAPGESVIYPFMYSEDISATLHALRDMGLCTYELAGDICRISGGLRGESKTVIDCGESGSTLRFLLPLAADGKERMFIGRGRLLERPMHPYEEIFREQKILFQKEMEGLRIAGKIRHGRYKLTGDVSSQFITGLLFVLPLLKGDSTIKITTQLESRSYVDLTRHIQGGFGILSRTKTNHFLVGGGQKYHAQTFAVEGDYSHAAFFAVAAAMGGEVLLSGLRSDSKQGDREILDILQCVGAKVQWEKEGVRILHNTLKPVEIDVSQIPDLVPSLAILACAIRGKTRIFNAARVRYKESDRLHAMATELETLGADIVEYEDSLIINGTGRLSGGRIQTHGDHRVAMALTMASVIAEAPVVIDDPSVVKKSAPRFFEEFSILGGRYI